MNYQDRDTPVGCIVVFLIVAAVLAIGSFRTVVRCKSAGGSYRSPESSFTLFGECVELKKIP